jgi:hypothetical protein
MGKRHWSTPTSTSEHLVGNATAVRHQGANVTVSPCSHVFDDDKNEWVPKLFMVPLAEFNKVSPKDKQREETAEVNHDSVEPNSNQAAG